MGLAEDPFDWHPTAAGAVRISRGGRIVVTVAGEQARRLTARLQGASDAQVQQLLARATGNYRRGNERP